jgi:sugar-specific transcriptional regulator TrmB
MDVSTFKLLKESNQYHPEITQVIHSWDKLLELSLNAVEICEKGFDSVWDAQFLTFLLNNFKEGFSIGRKKMKTKGIKSRFVIEFTRENIDSFDLYDLGEIRHLDGIRGNFGIMDSRCYMVYILLTDNKPPSQGVFSNSKILVEKQQKIFDELWDMGIPLSSRIRELERQASEMAPNIITNHDEIHNEIYYLSEQSKKELLIFSSTKLLHDIMKRKSNFFTYFYSLPSRGISIKILVDNFDEYLMNAIDISINKSKINNNNTPIQLRYSNKLGNFNEMVIMSDGKHLFQIKYNQNGKLEALYSNEKHQIFIQEILFEKFWNEVESLSNAPNNI